MTLIKWTKPANGHSRNEFFPPFPGMFEDLFGTESFFKRDFAHFVPAVNIAEAADHFVIELSAPGFSKEDFRLEIENLMMTITGEKKSGSQEAEKNYTRKEFGYGSFKRTFTLPQSVDIERTEAKYENGILAITLWKKDEAKAKPVKEIRIS